LFNNTKRYINKSLNKTNEIEEEMISSQSYSFEESELEQVCDTTCSVILENFEETLEEKIYKNQSEKQEKIHDKFVIRIPNNAVKQDLIDLKVYLLNLET
jgi:hypothetical protein